MTNSYTFEIQAMDLAMKNASNQEVYDIAWSYSYNYSLFKSRVNYYFLMLNLERSKVSLKTKSIHAVTLKIPYFEQQ